MPQVRNVGPDPVSVPFIGRTVEVDELITITDEQFTGTADAPRNWDIPGSWEIVTTAPSKKDEE
jgi:hypothetical protein